MRLEVRLANLKKKSVKICVNLWLKAEEGIQEIKKPEVVFLRDLCVLCGKILAVKICEISG